MSTTFASLYSSVRYFVLRRDDSDVLPDTEIDLAIENIIEFDFVDGFTVSGVAGSKLIDPDLSQDEKKLLIYKTALSILLPEDAFSYRTVSLSKFIEGTPGLEDQKEDLRRRIADIDPTATSMPIKSTNEFDDYLNRGTRLDETISDALSG